MKSATLLEKWNSVKLSSVLITLESGSRPKGGVSKYSKGIPSVGGEHIRNDGIFNFSNVKFVPKDFYKKQKQGLIQKGDVLVVKDGATTGKVSIIDEDYPFSESIVNEHVFLLRTNPKLILPEYLFHYIFSRDGQKQIKKNFHGAAIGGINKKFTDNFFIPLPSIPEQQHIASKLDYVLLLRKRKHKINIFSKSLLQSAFMSIFGDFSEYDWKTSKLEELIVEKPQNGLFKKNSFYGDGEKIVWVENVDQRGILRTENLRKIQVSEKEISKYSIQKQDVVITRSSHLGKSGVGIMNVVPSLNESVLFESHIMKLQTNKKILNPYYLCSFFNTNFGRNQIESKATQATMSTINQPDLLSMKIIVPPIDLQEKFEEVMKKINKILDLFNTSTQSIDTISSNLYHFTFKGVVDL